MSATMTLTRQVNRALDDEHRANLELLAKVEQAFSRADARDAALAATFGRQVEHELSRHFGFEEHDLFPLLDSVGAADLATLLLEEHETIRQVATDLLPLAQAAATLDDAGWVTLRRCALEMVERLRAHIDKETMALLPALEDALDDDTDRELAFAYAAQ